VITRSDPATRPTPLTDVAAPPYALAAPERADRAAWFEALHRASAVLPSRPLDADRVVDRAAQRAGHDNFGADFGDVRGALGAWLDASEAAGSLDPLGRAILALEVGWMLRSRLAVARAVADDPAVAAEPIRRPLFVLGLPRSGTTLLHRLLASADGERAPLTWELRRPEPLPAGPPGSEAAREAARRRQHVARQLQVLFRLRPDFTAIHPIAVDEPEECVVAMHHTFLTMHCDAVVRAPRYLSWLSTQDLRPAYRYHRAILGLWQRGRPRRRWVLKAPAHLHSLAALCEVYPDARFVHLHRDLREVAPSGCSLTTASRCITARRIERRQLGAEWIHNWGEAMDRGLAARARIDGSRIIDVHFDDLMADPAALVRRVRAHFGDPPPSNVEASVARYCAPDRDGRLKRHQYSLAEFGIDPGWLGERFAGYLNAFDAAAGAA